MTRSDARLPRLEAVWRLQASRRRKYLTASDRLDSPPQGYSEAQAKADAGLTLAADHPMGPITE